jgi:hypothetical protein
MRATRARAAERHFNFYPSSNVIFTWLAKAVRRTTPHSLDQKGQAMSAVSPFSIIKSLAPAASVLGTLAGDIAERGRGKSGAIGTFSKAFDTLDANNDGKLNARDVIGHAKGIRNAVLTGIAGGFGADSSPRPGAAGPSGPATAPARARISAFQPAPPSNTAARAVQDLPGIAEIRATYATMSGRFMPPHW